MAEDGKEIRVGGFMFREGEYSDRAKREVEGVRYVKDRVTMDNPQAVHEIYNRLLNQEMFVTPVGISYLRELQEYLYSSPAIPNRDIRPIPVEDMLRKQFDNITGRERKKKRGSGPLALSIGINVVLFLMAVAMFVISLSSKSPTVLNYREEIQNEYSEWQTELTEREERVREKERELGISGQHLEEDTREGETQ